MEDGVVVLLRVRHPDDGVDPRKDRLDALAMGRLDGVQVGQVEDRDVAEHVAGVVAHLVLGHAQPAE